jgi:hypothetical protein
MTKLLQILPNNLCINFMTHVGLINDSQVVILHKTLKCVYQKETNINEGNLSCWVTYKVNMTLTFDPLINRGYLLAKTNVTTQFEGQQSMSWDIDQKALLHIRSMWSWPLTPQRKKIHWGHLLAKSNASVKLEGQESIGCPVIDRKPFWNTRSMQP